MLICPICEGDELDWNLESVLINDELKPTGKFVIICLECQHHWTVDDLKDDDLKKDCDEQYGF